MKTTGERRAVASTSNAEEQVQDAFHLFPYHYVKRLVTPDTRVLEVGFGEGYGAEILSGSIAEYVGLDVSDEAVAHATSRYALPNVRFEQADATAIPSPPASFDVVVSFHVLEHIAEADAYLREIGRVCRAGGRLVIVTPNGAFRVARGERPWNRFHVHEYDHVELAQLLSRRFEEVAVMGITGDEAMNAVERARVSRARAFARLDPLGLRYRLPEPLLVRVRRGLTVAARRSAQPPMRADFTHADVRCVEDELDQSVHLLALIDRTENDRLDA